MTDSHRYPDVVVRVNNTINWINDMDGQPRQPFANSYSEMIKVLSNVTFDDEDPYQLNAAIRGWLWLCCNELGVLQSTNLGRNVFQQIIPLKSAFKLFPFVKYCLLYFIYANYNVYVMEHPYYFQFFPLATTSTCVPKRLILQ
uniref:MT domain-containing protein n=1 Tax=Heterorhabditis bacteriophora TaxID=37862 RepID=A0A1I7X697_HETBA